MSGGVDMHGQNNLLTSLSTVNYSAFIKNTNDRRRTLADALWDTRKKKSSEVPATSTY